LASTAYVPHAMKSCRDLTWMPNQVPNGRRNGGGDRKRTKLRSDERRIYDSELVNRIKPASGSWSRWMDTVGPFRHQRTLVAGFDIALHPVAEFVLAGNAGRPGSGENDCRGLCRAALAIPLCVTIASLVFGTDQKVGKPASALGRIPFAQSSSALTWIKQHANERRYPCCILQPIDLREGGEATLQKDERKRDENQRWRTTVAKAAGTLGAASAGSTTGGT
jgi:hypothetical protein